MEAFVLDMTAPVLQRQCFYPSGGNKRSILDLSTVNLCLSSFQPSLEIVVGGGELVAVRPYLLNQLQGMLLLQIMLPQAGRLRKSPQNEMLNRLTSFARVLTAHGGFQTHCSFLMTAINKFQYFGCVKFLEWFI